MWNWANWFLDSDKRGAWNRHGGGKFGPFLISVVAEITDLWVENSQKINCRDVKSIREGRVVSYADDTTSYRSSLSLQLYQKRLWQRCFLMNFAKFLRTPFLQNTSGRLLLSLRHEEICVRVTHNLKDITGSTTIVWKLILVNVTLTISSFKIENLFEIEFYRTYWIFM